MVYGYGVKLFNSNLLCTSIDSCSSIFAPVIFRDFEDLTVEFSPVLVGDTTESTEKHFPVTVSAKLHARGEQ